MKQYIAIILQMFSDQLMWYRTSSHSSIFGPFLCVVIFTAGLPISSSCCLEIRSPNLFLSFLWISHTGFSHSALLRPCSTSSLRVPSQMWALGLARPWEPRSHPLQKSLETYSQMRTLVFHNPLRQKSKCFCQVCWAGRKNLEYADVGGISWASLASPTPASLCNPAVAVANLNQ